jgi:hypothetical protein
MAVIADANGRQWELPEIEQRAFVRVWLSRIRVTKCQYGG